MPKIKWPEISKGRVEVEVPSSVMKQVGVDIRNLPEVDGCRHDIALIDDFPKWSEAKPTKDKSALTIVQFLYEVMY